MPAEGCGIPVLAGPAVGCPAEGSSNQESSCVISLGLAKVLAACAVEVKHRTGQVPLGRQGKVALQGCLGHLGEGFSTHQLVFSQPELPCCPCSVMTFGFSALCVYVNPAMCFRCACVQQRELLCASCRVVGCVPRHEVPFPSFLGKLFC